MSAQAIAGLVTPDDTAARFADDRSGREYAPSIADADIFVCPRHTQLRLGHARVDGLQRGSRSQQLAANHETIATTQGKIRWQCTKTTKGGNR